MYIHFEGLDLAGKSTVCRLLQAAVPRHWELRRNALLLDNPVHELADRLRRERFAEEPVGWLYYAALLYDLEAYQRPKGDVIQDSTILLRSLAYHSVRGTPGLPERFEMLVDRHPRFDRSFVLVADHRTRLDRLNRRRKKNLGPEDFLVRDDPNMFYAMEKVLVDYATRYFRAEVIDTSGELDSQWIESFLRNHLPELVTGSCAGRTEDRSHASDR